MHTHLSVDLDKEDDDK